VEDIYVPLRELDEVAYLRFTSVYRRFESADDFETEVAMLRAESWRSNPVRTPPGGEGRPARVPGLQHRQQRAQRHGSGPTDL
jgi:hypothetical protein